MQHDEWGAEHQLATVHIERQNQQEGQTEYWHYAYDLFIWHAHILPLHKKLRQQMGLKAPAPRKPALTRRILYYHTGHLGTPRELTNTNGSIVWAATYRAWGATQSVEHPPILHVIQDGNTLQQQWVEQNRYDKPVQNLRFQGQYFDAETGLHYNRFRYYDPEVGRFVSQDPIGLFGGNNLYQYAPNPVEWVDPWGLTPKLWNPSINAPEIFKGPYGNIYRDKNLEWARYWSKDIDEHGGLNWKIYKKTSKGFEWVADADEHGQMMQNKHKGERGKFIHNRKITKAKSLCPRNKRNRKNK